MTRDEALMLLVFPAPAGMNRYFRKRGREPKRIPRASGDEPPSGSS